jgi:hypothetical protein
LATIEESANCEADPVDWSPADNPYAIAVSEAQWWLRATRLAILRIRDGDDRRSAFSSRQIDARHTLFALRQLLTAERLERLALKTLGIDKAVGDALAQARRQFEAALPGLKHMRDALTHFDDWSRGQGFGPQKARRDAGEELRDVARAFWGFAYDPNDDAITLGPYAINLETAGLAAAELAHAIYMAAREVDKTRAANLCSRAIGAITSAGMPCNGPEDIVRVVAGPDLRVWLSLVTKADSSELDYESVSARVVAALGSTGLHLVLSIQPQSRDACKFLAQGMALYVDEGGTNG